MVDNCHRREPSARTTQACFKPSTDVTLPADAGNITIRCTRIRACACKLKHRFPSRLGDRCRYASPPERTFPQQSCLTSIHQSRDKTVAENKSDTTRIHCNVCLNETNHVNLLTRRQDGSAPYDEQCDISWSTIYDVFECCGCESVTMRRRHYFSEWNHGDHELDFYPPRVGRRIPDWKSKLGSEMQHLMDEVYAALQADSRSLAMMGARALIDMVIVDKIGDAGSFPSKT